MKESDDLLIKLCLEGDKDAFGLLVKKYQNPVYNLCYHIVGNFADAEDLAQDIFVKAYLDLSKIKEPSKFAGWLYRIAVNICKMWIRAKRAVSVIPIDDIAPMQCEFNDDRSPDSFVETKELNGSIRKALEVLSEIDRNVMLLYYIVGLKCDEIAYSLNLSLPAVKNRLLRARRQLKKELIPMMESSFGRHEVNKNFTENVLQRVSNYEGSGFFQVDTKSGKIWWLKSEDEKGVYIGQPEGVIEGKPGTYLPHENKSGAGLFILDTTTGKAWWSGDYWIDETHPHIPKNLGQPETKAGEVGTYVPYDNDIGAGFRIVNTKTEDAWWTNGTDWGKAGKVGKDQLALSATEKEQKKALLLKCDKLLNERKHKEAIDLLQELYDRYSSDWFYAEYALGGIGRCYWKLGQNEKAIEYFEKAINKHQYMIGFTLVVYYYLGLAYADSGNKEKAIEALEKCVELSKKEGRNEKLEEAKKKIEELT